MSSTINNIDGWRYYNHAAIPTSPAYKNPNLEPVYNKKIWFIENKKPLLVRWTTNFDCKEETNFWYIIKDNPLDLDDVNSHYRNHIRKGIKNFLVKIINPYEYEDKLIEIQKHAFSAYQDKGICKIEEKPFYNSIYFGAFFRETNELCGYIVAFENENEITLDSMRTIPSFEKFKISEALVNGMLEYYKNELSNGKYINDGSRNVLHGTNFQDFLIRKFAFRRAYCNLHIVYNSYMNIIVKVLYPFRKFIKNKKVKAVLLMEELSKGNTKDGK